MGSFFLTTVLPRPLAAAAILAAVTSASADVIELQNGQKYTGSMSRQGDAMVIKTDDGQSISAKPADILRVTLTGPAAASSAAPSAPDSATEWKRLSTQIKAADNLQTIIDLHQKFLAKFPAAVEADDARSSLQVYQQLASSGGVKFRGRWMPREQIEVTLRQWADAARPALVYYRAGAYKEAVESAKSLLKADDQNPDLLTIAGLAAFRDNNFPQARAFFTALITADPTSTVLAENNLAVVASMQKSSGGIGESLLHYDKALQIAPDNRFLLDNAAEALNAYTGDKNTATYRNFYRTFEAAETRMEAAMAKNGLQRWGSTWVTAAQLDALKKNQRTIENEMARLDGQYQLVRSSLAGLDAQIKQAETSFNEYQAAYNSYIVPTSQFDEAFYASRDMAYQDMQRTARYKVALEAQRNQIAANSAPLFAQAEKLKAAFAAAQSKYAGQQRLLELGDLEHLPPPLPVALPAPAGNALPPAEAPQPPATPNLRSPVPVPAPTPPR